jgi:ribosomal protein L16 Arg81 hydroxylase
MSSLQQWVGAEAWLRFTRDHRGKRPFAMALAPSQLLTSCDWDHLGQTLGAHAADVQVVRLGEVLSIASPQSLADLHDLFGRDAGIAVRNAELVSERVRAICAAVEQDVPGRQRASVFATPENTHSLAWHFDADELFIIQLAGSKTHHLRANTVVPSPQVPSGHTLAAYPLETSPLLTIDLRPGDFLYVPCGFWHMALARSTSLSLSIGVLAAPAPAKPRLGATQRAALHNRIGELRTRLANVRAAAAEWSTTALKPRRRHG